MATFAVPAVPVFPPGYQPQNADFTLWWFDTAAFLETKMAFRGDQENAATTIPDTGAVTTIGLDTAIEDPYGGFNATTHLWTPPAGYSGWFDVCYTLRTAAQAANGMLQIVMAGTYSYAIDQALGSTSTGAGISAQFRCYLVGGQDSIGLAAQLKNATANLNTSITAGLRSTMEIMWTSQS